jgi:hypothetical protein
MDRASTIANNAYITGVPGAEEVLLYHRSNNNHLLTPWGGGGGGVGVGKLNFLNCYPRGNRG